MFISQILEGLKNINKPQLKFLVILFQIIFVSPAKINFSTLGRNSRFNEHAFRRQFQKEFDFARLNQEIIKQSECQIKAKQSAGLNDCRARDNQAIESHWNTVLTSVNLAGAMSQMDKMENEKKSFSMRTIKQQVFNENLLKLFISKLGLEQSLIK